jgi:anti-sigma regulatory factor (Ser/Thr protein kinase)
VLIRGGRRGQSRYCTRIVRKYGFRLLGSGPRVAARQAALLFALAGALALVGLSTQPENPGRLLIVAAGDAVIALSGLLVPWRRLPPGAPAVLGALGFAVLGLSTWSFGGTAAGTGPFLVLLYAWAAMHFSRRVLTAFTVPAAAAYIIPLVLTHQRPEIIGSAFVLLPIAYAIAFLIEAQGRHLRLDERVVPARELVVSSLSYLRSADVLIEVAPALQICVDPARFEQIIINLVGNALKYGKPPITVRISEGDGVDRLEVRDHGPGIPDELRERLFSPFAAGPDGVGLGLWIVRRLAEAHGGRVAAERRQPGIAMVVTFRKSKELSEPSPRGVSAH